MEIVLNRKFGSFSISDFAKEKLGIDTNRPYDMRTDERFIDLIKEYGSSQVSGRFANLQIFEMPENTTDYIVNEYDGFEILIYVVDGKICDF